MKNQPNVPRKPYNPIRIIEWILTLICVVTAIYIYFAVPKLPTLIRAFLITIAFTYFLITSVDLCVRCLLKPMLWTTWLLFATAASLSFYLCGGLLMGHLGILGVTLYVFSVLINITTGIIFLLELLHLLMWLLAKTPDIHERKLSSWSNATQTEAIKLLPCHHVMVEVVNQPSCICKNQETVTCPKNKCEKEIHVRQSPTWDTPSHGGTFHVSKDVAPITSFRAPASEPVTPREIKRCSNSSCDQTAYPATNKPQRLVECRTVSASVRTVIKPQKEVIVSYSALPGSTLYNENRSGTISPLFHLASDKFVDPILMPSGFSKINKLSMPRSQTCNNINMIEEPTRDFQRLNKTPRTTYQLSYCNNKTNATPRSRSSGSEKPGSRIQNNCSVSIKASKDFVQKRIMENSPDAEKRQTLPGAVNDQKP